MTEPRAPFTQAEALRDQAVRSMDRYLTHSTTQIESYRDEAMFAALLYVGDRLGEMVARIDAAIAAEE